MNHKAYYVSVVYSAIAPDLSERPGMFQKDKKLVLLLERIVASSEDMAKAFVIGSAAVKLETDGYTGIEYAASVVMAADGSAPEVDAVMSMTVAEPPVESEEEEPEPAQRLSDGHGYRRYHTGDIEPLLRALDLMQPPAGGHLRWFELEDAQLNRVGDLDNVDTYDCDRALRVFRETHVKGGSGCVRMLHFSRGEDGRLRCHVYGAVAP